MTPPRAKLRPAPPPPSAAAQASMDNIARRRPPASCFAPKRVETPRDRIAADVEAFLTKGGRIQVLPYGACSQPLKHDHSDQRAKGRAAQKRTRKTTST